MQYKMSQSDWLRIGEEAGWLKEGEKVVLAELGKSNVAGAVFRLMRTPEMEKKIIELSKLWKSNSKEFRNKFQDLKQQILHDYNIFLNTRASDDDLFIGGMKLHRIIEKIIYKMLEVGDLGVREASEEEPSTMDKMAKGCWKGYKRIGGKKKNGRMVPNCVPKGK